MDRLIKFEGCFNFRDLGGYPTRDGRTLRWRTLFRSDALHNLTAADVAHMRDELGVGVVIDLRSSVEIRDDGRGLLGDRREVRFHHVPLFDRQTVERAAEVPIHTLADRYYLLAEFAKTAIAEVVTAIAESDAPAVYHCAAGKDRTGVISAVLLGVLDVPDEVIVADYAATQENLEAIIERLMGLEGYKAMLTALPPDTLHAEPETMIALLERIRSEYGSMPEYALAAGIAEESLARLRSRLIGPAR
jgi:protein-tyrosine phosphatase